MRVGKGVERKGRVAAAAAYLSARVCAMDIDVMNAKTPTTSVGFRSAPTRPIAEYETASSTSDPPPRPGDTACARRGVVCDTRVSLAKVRLVGAAYGR